jgi:hypothetical protein
MNKHELEEILVEKGIPKVSFSVDGVKDGERICLINKDTSYIVAYNSRGIIDELRKFDNENDACEFMLNRILKGYHGLK